MISDINYTNFSEAKLKKLKEKYAIKENPFNCPVRNYMKYKRKLAQYDDLYSKSKLSYYSLLGKNLTFRYIRKRLFPTFVNMLMMIFGLYFSKKSGLLDFILRLKDKTLDKLSFIYLKLKSIIF
jgi:hypothetical protein